MYVVASLIKMFDFDLLAAWNGAGLYELGECNVRDIVVNEAHAVPLAWAAGGAEDNLVALDLEQFPACFTVPKQTPVVAIRIEQPNR